MKLHDATVYVKICELGNYSVEIYADDAHDRLTGIKAYKNKFELPVGNRAILTDLATILQMVAEELSR